MNLENDGVTFGSIFARDYTLWEVRLRLVAVGFFIYLVIFLISHYLISWMSNSYNSLQPKDKFFLTRTVMRGVFGIQGCIGGLWALLLDPVFQVDKVYAQQDWSWFHCLIASGFFLVENVTLIVFSFVFKTFDWILFVHHILAFGGYFGLVVNIKSGHYIPLMGMMLDMSTPFACVSWMLLKVRFETKGKMSFKSASYFLVIILK